MAEMPLTITFDSKPLIAAIQEVLDSGVLHQLVDEIVRQGVVAEGILRAALDEAAKRMTQQ